MTMLNPWKDEPRISNQPQSHARQRTSGVPLPSQYCQASGRGLPPPSTPYATLASLPPPLPTTERLARQLLHDMLEVVPR